MNILEDLKALAEKHGTTIEDLSYEIKKAETAAYDEKIRNTVKENEDLVGKCFVKKVKQPMFPEMNKYYKVISNRSENEYRVECLVFYEHPTYWFEYKAHKIHFAGDYFCGRYQFNSFNTDSCMAKDVRHYTEISLEEYNKAAKRFTDEMLELEWPADHYRFGDKLPTDKEWPRKEKK